MITDPKTLGDMAFNLAITGSYALPEVGAVVGAQLAAGQFLWDLLYPPGPGLDDPDEMVPTNADLKNDLDDLATKLAAGSFELDLANHASTVLGINDELNETAKLMYKHLTKPTQKEITDWQDSIENRFNKGVAPLTIAKQWVEGGKSSHGTKTFDLYALIGSVQIAFHKFHTLWEYNKTIENYPTDLAAYNKQVQQHTIWENGGQQGPEPFVMEKPLPVGSDADATSRKVMADFQKHFLLNSTPATELGDCVAALIDDKAYGPTLSKDMLANWKDRQDKVDARLAKIVVQPTGGGYAYVDNETGDIGPVNSMQFMADAQAKVKRGTVELAIWRDLTDKYQLADVKLDDIQQFADTIQTWKKTGDMLKNYDPSLLKPPH